METMDETQKSEELQLQLNELIKKYNQRENVWKKDKALLMQQLDIQQIQINESKIREQNLKKMNETFLLSISDSNEKPVSHSQNRLIKDIQRSIDTNNRDNFESKNKLQEVMSKQESRIKELEENLHEKELRLKDMENLKDKQMMLLQNQLIEAKSKEDLHEQKIQKFQADAKYRKDINQFEHSAQIKDLNQQLNNVKIESKKEQERLKCQFDIELKRTKFQQAIKKSISVDDTNKIPQSKLNQTKTTEMENKFKEERKKLKSQILSHEVSNKQLKEKIEKFTNQIRDFEHLQNDMMNMSSQIQNLIDCNNELSGRLQDNLDDEGQLKCQIVELQTELDEEKALNERLQQQCKLQETASLGINFKFGTNESFDMKSKENQSPCRPTTRMKQLQMLTQANQLTNTRQYQICKDYSQLTLNPVNRLSTVSSQNFNKLQKTNWKENLPDVSQFSTNQANTSFKVHELIQNASIGGEQSIQLMSPLKERESNFREQELQDQLSHMQSKLYKVKKIITTSSIQENSYIRQSIQKIRSRSRNNSFSMNAELSELH